MGGVNTVNFWLSGDTSDGGRDTVLYMIVEDSFQTLPLLLSLKHWLSISMGARGGIICSCLFLYHSFIHPIIYLLKTYNVSGTVLGAEDT